MRKIGTVLALLGLSFCPGFCGKALAAMPAPEISALESQAVTKEQVKAEFLHAWNGYKQYAWGHDELKPLSKGWSDWYGEPLLITPVDALDTMLVMGLEKEAAEAKQLIFSQLNFDKDMEVQHFEISIRVLGGLISSYQLDGDKRLLKLATELADRMSPVWNSKTGMPYRYLNLKTGKVSGALSGPAEIGTYVLEYGTLSKLTGNPAYYEKAKKAMTAVYERRSQKTGLMGSVININSGRWVVKDSSVGGGIDSYYECCLKGAILFQDPELKAMWDTHVAAINKYLADESTGNLWYGHAGMNSGKRSLSIFGALDAFFPAMLALGGDLEAAARLENSCYKMWSLHGIEPEMTNYKSMKVIAPNYPLRPEIIESAYYLYHFTGDEKYRRMANNFFNSTVKYCRTDAGYATLSDVRSKKQADSQPSYFLAENMKYFYLISDPEALDFNKVIFTTEAHPMFKTSR